MIVGESGPDSEDFAVASGVAKAWAKWTNANGGVNGHPVQVIALDDQASPAVGLADVHTLIDGDHVLAASCFGLGCIQNLGPYAAQKHVPLIGAEFSNSYSASLGNANVYEVDTSLASEEAALWQFVKKAGATKMGFVTDVQTGGANTYKIWKQAVLDAGLTYTKAVTINDVSPNFVAPCLALKQTGADVIGSSIGDQPIKAFMDSCATQGFKPIVTGQSIDLTPTWLHDPAFDRAISTIPDFPWWDTTIPAVKTFNQVMAQYDPSALKVNPAGATNAWATMTVFAAGATAGHMGDNPTSAQLVAGLNTINNETFGGITPPLTYTNGGNLIPPLCVHAAQVTNGQFKLLNGGNTICTTAAEATKLHSILIASLTGK
jgi:branched-chain amino acid transport system substrate-binding protein